MYLFNIVIKSIYCIVINNFVFIIRKCVKARDVHRFCVNSILFLPFKPSKFKMSFVQYVETENKQIVLTLLTHSPFHKTLPRSSLQMHWVKVRFYEMVDTIPFTLGYQLIFLCAI